MSDQMLQRLFDEAIELPPEQRSGFLEKACGSDLELRQELDALLAADADAAHETAWQHSALRSYAMDESSNESAAGRIIGSYRLVEMIGRGGMGAVYRAERIDAAFDKCVAIKLIDGLFQTSGLIAHFRTERQILANLEHPNIARLLDGGATEDGSPYLVMEYVEGISPYDFCREHNLSLAERLVLFRKICSAVHFAHQNMVIHRDLKPANILVMEDGTPKLLDFGIAKVFNLDPLTADPEMTEPGLLKLTARYASPEQVLGKPITTASDVYSLGVILFELLTGHSPYGDAQRARHEMMRAVCEEQPARPSIWNPKLRGDLDNIILHALEKQPLDRYASADQFSADILQFLEGRPVLARGHAPLYVAAKFVRRNRVAVIASTLVLSSLVAGLIAVTFARARADHRFNQVRQLAHSVIFDYADAIDRLPGSTPVRERLIKDALTYLDSLSQEADSPQLQKEIVDAYVRVSNVQGNEYENNMGDPAAALVSARKAVAGAERLLREDETIPARESAASAFATEGSLLYSTGDLAAADRAYQRAIGLRGEIADEISTRSPQNLENQLALATDLNHLGDLYGGYGFQNLGKTPESLAYYNRAKTLVAQLTAQYPGNIEVAKESYETLMSLSSAENAAGKHQDATKDLTDTLAQIEKVRSALPHDTNVTWELANTESRLGQMLIDGREFPLAITHLTHASDLLQSLIDADPGNAVFRRGQSIAQGQLAVALRGAGQVQEGLAHSQNYLRLALALSHDAPESAQYHIDVGISQRKLSEALLAAGDAAEALRHANEALQVLCQKDSPTTDPGTQANCGRAQLAAGMAYLVSQNPKAAQVVLRRAVEIASGLQQADPQSAIPRSDQARAQAALASALAMAGDAEAARAMYQAALAGWATLRRNNSITVEDAYRADQAARALVQLRPR